MTITAIIGLALSVAAAAAIARGGLALAASSAMAIAASDVLDRWLGPRSGSREPTHALRESLCERWGELFVLSGYVWYLRDSRWLFAAMAAFAGSMMMSYTRARAQALGIDVVGCATERARRIALVAGGTSIAALEPTHALGIVGGVMMLCGVTSITMAIHRGTVAYRELAARDAR